MAAGADLVDGVVRFARRVHAPAAGSHHVASPLGAWLLVALGAPAMAGSERDAASEALGMEPDDAAREAAALLAEAPPAIHAAVAVWWRAERATAALDSWVSGLPAQVETGDMPAQAQADEWADRHTDHLIGSMPLRLTEDSTLVLASAVATRVSWRSPHDTAPSYRLGKDSPWSGQVERVLHAESGAFIVRTSAAGLVGVLAKEAGGLTVVSVIAAREVDSLLVLDVAHRLAVEAVNGELQAASLFDLPLGEGEAWTINEKEVETDAPHGREELVTAVLPAWSARSTHDLSAPAGAFDGFADGLRVLLRPSPRGYGGVAAQSAMAEYTREGFAAAAVTAWATFEGAAMFPRLPRGLLRSATVRFGRPHAVVAVATLSKDTNAPALDAWHGLPVFSAWVCQPDEVPPEPHGGIDSFDVDYLFEP